MLNLPIRVVACCLVAFILGGCTGKLTREVGLWPEDIQSLYPIYIDTARANLRSTEEGLAVVPSPAYANGMYARDAFYTALGLGDEVLFEQAYRRFEAAQDPVSGQIPTALPLNPADASLIPQDDEVTLIFLIWSGLLARMGYEVDEERINLALSFVEEHVEEGRYISAPGQFRYWADCWRLDEPASLTYNQGLYALALKLLHETHFSPVDEDRVERAAAEYRRRYDPAVGLLGQQESRGEVLLQDGSALLPEFLYRWIFSEGLLQDAEIVQIVDTRLSLAGVRNKWGALVGLKIIAGADGGFIEREHFACPTLSKPGDYQNGGHWPLFSTIELALAYSVDPKAEYQRAITQLINRDLYDGSPKEYWELSDDRLGAVNAGRDEHAWNVLIVPALHFAGLIEPASSESLPGLSIP